MFSADFISGKSEVAHLHNAARALSSPSGCLSKNLGKDFFRYL